MLCNIFIYNSYGQACWCQPRTCYDPPISVFPAIKPPTPAPSQWLAPPSPWGWMKPVLKPPTPAPTQWFAPTLGWTKPVLKPTLAQCQCCKRKPGYYYRLYKSPKRLLTPYGRERHRWRLDQKWNLAENETKRKSRRAVLERKGFKRPLKRECEWPYCPRKQFKRRRPWMTLDKFRKSPSMLSPRSPRDRSPILFLRTP